MNSIVSLKRKCPVCMESEGWKLHSQRFVLPEGHPLKDGYDVVLCQFCGFAFADTKTSQEDYDRYYASLSKYADAATSTGGSALAWESQRLRETAQTIVDHEPDLSAWIIDIGCANGGLLAELKARGYNRLAGIDPSPGCVASTKELTGAEAWPGTLFEMPLLKDVRGVILSHVMEHVRDLRPALEGIHNLLAPEGWIYVEVPDAMRYEECLVAPFQDFNTEHINHFSLMGLHSLLKTCGFEPFAGGSKTILSAPKMPYPAIWKMARKTSLQEGDVKPFKDLELAPALEAYVQASAVLLGHLDDRLARILADHPRLIVWGTGQLTLKLLAETRLGQAQIVAFVDTNPVHQGTFLQGKPVLAPRELEGLKGAILVASLINAESILGSIKKLRISNPVFTLSKEASL